ncbi:MAG: flippase-like domain-containing protein [Gemmatimonadota bacterium]|nr:flippase-like domain-containing protein [Gemmatimonadota bacterium]
MKGGWRRIAGGIFVVVAFGFLLWFVTRNVAELRAHEWRLRPGLLAASLALHIAGLLWGVFVWRMLLRRMGFGVGYRELARIWFVSGLGRYIPGKIWQFVGAAHLGGQVGLSATVTVTALMVHSGIFTIAAVLVGVYALPPDLIPQIEPVVRAARLGAPLLLLFLHPVVVQTGFGLIHRITGKDLGHWNGRWRDGVLLVLLATISWVVVGLGFTLFVESLTTVRGATTLALVAVNALAFVAGVIVFIAPAGLGAKEGAFAAMLALFMPASVAALVAIAARLWAVAAEVIPALALLPRSSGVPVSEAGSPADARPPLP